MKKTSRRTFGKELTGALAATALTSLVGNAQRPSARKDLAEEFFRTHDTPPPLEFENGSLVLETAVEFNNAVVNGNRKEYRMPPRVSTMIFPAHLRILAGNGEQLYYKDGSDRYQVIIELRDAAGNAGSSVMINAQATANQDAFVVDVDTGSEFQLGNHANKDKPSSKKRIRRYRHSASDDLSMFKVIVKDLDSSAIKKTINVRDLGAQGADLKVMIWLEPWA